MLNIGNGQLNQIIEKKLLFLRENIIPIQDSGHLSFVDNEKKCF